MKKIFAVMLGFLVLAPGLVFAVSANGQGAANGNSNTSGASVNSPSTSGSTVDTTQNQAQTQVQTQTQTSNPGTGTMTQAQIEEQARIQEEIKTSSPQYTPKNSKGAEQKNIVAIAVEAMLQVANKTENQGVGDQIKIIAQTQSQNQDKIGQSIDKAETRSGFTKFFIGANYKELKLAKQTIVLNQNQIKELEQIMAQLSVDTDKVSIANQIIILQQNQLELKDQIEELSDGFSFFGWINRWKNNY